jgi:TolB-like protein
MASFVSELRRRNVLRAAAFYAASAWLIVQVATQVFPFFNVPAWTIRWIVISAAIGFPFLLAFAWFYELTPRGLVRESDIDPADSIVRHTGKQLDRWIIAVMAVAIVLLLANQFMRRKDDAVSTPAGAPEKSIAVLPFTDLSPAHDQEYFSDGMAEELLNALAKLKDLKVAGRTSSFSFKGKNEDLRAMGKVLGVANILEGSLRKQGDKVRITAQLIQVSDGFHLWSETYDGDVSDVFALQEHIAQAIAAKLEVVLHGTQQRIVPISTTNAEAYALYMQATGIFNRREGAHFADAIAQLEQAIKLDPKYARAYARLAAVEAIAPTYMSVADISAITASAEGHARIASSLDPTLAEPYGALGQSASIARRYSDSRAAFERAQELDPDDTTSAFWYAAELIMTGYRAKGDAIIDHLLAIDPVLPTALLWRGMSYVYAGDLEKGERFLKRAADGKLVFAGLGLSFIADKRNEKAEAISDLAAAFKALDPKLPSDAPDTLAAGIFGDDAAHKQALDMVDRILADKPAVIPGVIVYSLLRMNEPSRALSLMREGTTSNDAVFLSMMWSPYGHDVLVLPEFPTFAKNIGFVAVWEKYGAPDVCSRTAPLEYVCH